MTPEERKAAKNAASRRYRARQRGENVPLQRVGSRPGKMTGILRREAVGYAGHHARIESARGKASYCVWGCAGRTRYTWANLTGDYHDVNDYAAMCDSCHRRFDNARQAMEEGFNGYYRRNRKLSPADVAEIVRLSATGEYSQRKIAAMFDSSQGHINHIIRGRRRTWEKRECL